MLRCCVVASLYRCALPPCPAQPLTRTPLPRPQREEEDEVLSNCPITGSQIPCTELECPDTKDVIPMCIVSGQHIVLGDVCVCPNSNMLAIHSEYIKYLHAEAKVETTTGAVEAVVSRKDSAVKSKWKIAAKAAVTATDPITDKPVSDVDLKRLGPDEVREYIRHYNQSAGDKEGEKEAPEEQ